MNLDDFDTATDGAVLLDEIERFYGRFVAFPSDHARVAVVLWAAHTHLAECFDSTPRLVLSSPEKQSGKSRTLELLELTTVGAENLSDASAPFMFRRIGVGSVTILLDECDAIWRRGKSDESAEALRSIVNAGHRKRATVGRVEMHGKKAELARFRVYAPVALAGIGSCLPDTILDRAVIVAMRRRAPDEDVEQYRERTTAPEGEDLGSRLAGWAASVADKVGCPWPDMPTGVADRPADVWEPLLMVADLAGGDWPKRARAACVAFVTGAREDTTSVGVRLLADLRDVFGDETALSTQTILERLHAMDEAPWADWYGHLLNERDLAKLLRRYRTADETPIKSRTVRIGDSTPRGYRQQDLYDAWRRYLPDGGATSATSATPLARAVADVAPVAQPREKETQQSCPPIDADTVVPSSSTTNLRSDTNNAVRSPTHAHTAEPYPAFDAVSREGGQHSTASASTSPSPSPPSLADDALPERLCQACGEPTDTNNEWVARRHIGCPETPPEPTCRVCGYRLHRLLVMVGDTVHHWCKED